jgi:hypothetical protein
MRTAPTTRFGETSPPYLLEIEEVALRFVLERVERGIPSFVEMWDDLGGQEWHQRKMAWLTDNRSRIDDALVV